MGGTTIKYGVVDENLTITDSGKISTEVNDYQVLLHDLISIIEPAAKTCDGISFSIPGSIDAKAGTIGLAGAISCLNFQPLKEDLTAVFQLPLAMENDANCAALAEYHSGVGRGTDNMVMIALGTGIGGAIIVDGKLLRTKNHFSGEFGYMIMGCEKPKAWDELDGSVVDRVGRIRKMDSRFEKMDGQQIFDLYQKDQIVTEQLEPFFRMLAIGCYNIHAILDTDLIVIGGGISSRDDFVGNLEIALSKLEVDPLLKNLPDIKVAEYRSHANLIGAYHHLAGTVLLK